MKKSLLALAALTAFAGASYAQSSVKLSGGVDMGIVRKGVDLPGGGTATNTSMAPYGSWRSAFALSGKEDLGGGMYASFYLNHRFNPATGDIARGGNNSADQSQFWRNSYVELGGDFGGIRLGRYLSPLQEVNGNYDAFGTGGVGSVHVNGFGNVRANNAIEYRTPDLGGFSALAMIAASENQGVSPDSKPAGFMVQYKGGPVGVALAWDKTADKRKTTGVYGSYDWGGGAVMAQYEGSKPDGGDTNKRYSISTAIPFGAVTAKAGYARWSTDNIKKLGLGMDYDLSKRTSLYADLGKLSGDGATDGMKKVMLDVGIYHKF
jgi:predicted porin